MTVPMSRCLDVVVPLDEEYRQQNRTAAFTLWDDAIIAEHDAELEKAEARAERTDKALESLRADTTAELEKACSEVDRVTQDLAESRAALSIHMAELEAIRRCVARSRPHGDPDWVHRTATQLKATASLRNPARPRKEATPP
jgi:hypothetical protein